MRVAALLAAIIFFGMNTVSAQSGQISARAHVIVYKASAKYRNLVPVLLSEDKKSVISYPGPTDIKTGSGYPLPVSLHKGYWLDKRGIGKNTAFLNITYEAYSKLETLPSPAGLYDLIIDKDPIRELYDCGIKGASDNSIKQLNELIDKNILAKKCNRMK